MTEQEKIQYFKMALGICNIGVSPATAELILLIYEELKLKEGEFTMKDATIIQANVTAKYEAERELDKKYDIDNAAKELIEAVQKIHNVS